MNTSKRMRIIVTVCAVFALAILGCNLPQNAPALEQAAPAGGTPVPADQPGFLAQFFATPLPPTPTLGFSSGDLQSFDVKIEAAEAGFEATGQATLTLTEAEMNAALINAIAEEGLSGELPVDNINVRLSNQQVLIYARLTAPPNSMGEIRLNPVLASDGSIDLVLAGVEFGGVPLPPGLFDSLVQQLETGINDWLHDDEAPVRITAIVVSEGVITLSAQSSP